MVIFWFSLLFGVGIINIVVTGLKAIFLGKKYINTLHCCDRRKEEEERVWLVCVVVVEKRLLLMIHVLYM